MNIANQKGSAKAFALLGERSFSGLFVTQFLGALNDNVFKAALLVYISYRAAGSLGVDTSQMLALAAALFVLPFLLLSAYAGQLADGRERAAMVRVIKFIEMGLMGIASVCFVLDVSWGTLGALLALLFMMGAQSTFFGPIKYSLIPSLLRGDEVVGANALVGGSTFLSILVGSILGTALASLDSDLWLVIAILGLAGAGWAASLFIPAVAIADPGRRMEPRPLRQAIAMIKHNRGNRLVWRCILGISWFWTIGAMYLTQLPAYAAGYLVLEESAVTVLLSILLLGIGLGALLCPLLLRRANTTALALPALLVMALSIAAFCLLSLVLAPQDCSGDCLRELAELFSRPALASLLLLSLLATAVAGGVFVVPLYISVQLNADRRRLSGTIATNNILNSLFMILSSIASMVAVALGSSVLGLFVLTGVFAICYIGLLPGPAPIPVRGDNDA